MKTVTLTKEQAKQLIERKEYTHFDEVDQADVHSIKNPAYVVKEITGSSGSEGGCIVEWNEEFKELTNFTPSDIDNSYCYQLIQGIQEVHNNEGLLCLLKNNDHQRIAVPICQLSCPFRSYSQQSPPEAQVIRNVWIFSKDQIGDPIRRQVDIYVFPYKNKQDSGKYALHILFDRKQARSTEYFKKKFCVQPVIEDFIPAHTLVPEKSTQPKTT